MDRSVLPSVVVAPIKQHVVEDVHGNRGRSDAQWRARFRARREQLDLFLVQCDLGGRCGLITHVLTKWFCTVILPTKSSTY